MKYSINGVLTQLNEKPKYVAVKKKIGKIVFKAIVYILLSEFVFVFVYPYLYMIVNSLKYEFDLKDYNREWVLTAINWDNYSEAITRLQFWDTLMNNVMVSFISTLGHVISCSIVAYGLARFEFKGRSIMFLMIIIYIIVPPQLLMMPLYMQYAKFGWLSTFLPIVVPSFFGFGLRGGLFIFIFRQFFKNLPQSYEEYAKIEGCGPFRIFIRIIMPLSKTSILVVAILSTIWHWNDYFEPRAYLFTGKNQLLSQKLVDVMSTYTHTTAEGNAINTVVLAACFLITLPLLIIYFIFQKQFMQGMEFSGMAN